MGQIIVRDLAEYADGAQIISATSTRQERESSKQVGMGKARGVFADIKDKKMSGGVAARCHHRHQLDALLLQCASNGSGAQAGCHYMEIALGGLFHVTREQQKLNDQLKKRNYCVLGMGAAPGMTNVIAAAGVAQFNTVETIDIVIGCIDFVEVDHPLCPPYASGHNSRRIYKRTDGLREWAVFSETADVGEIEVDFPKPVGKCDAILTLHSEVATLPETYRDKGVKGVTFSWTPTCIP